MLKKIIAAAAAILLMGAAAQAAEFYQDLEVAGSYVTVIDGCAYMSAHDAGAAIRAHRSEDCWCFAHGKNELKLREGSYEAELDGKSVTLSHTLVATEGENVLYPARDVAEALGGHVAFVDPDYLYTVFGKNVEEVSGETGDRLNGWTLTLPEGFYFMSPDLTTDNVTVTNFNGINLDIDKTDVNYRGYTDAYSGELDGYLIRTEPVTTDKGGSFMLIGKISSNATQENRDTLNAIIDSFKPYFADGAKDVSHLNEDGTKLLYNDPAEGIACELPSDRQYNTRGGGSWTRISAAFGRYENYNKVLSLKAEKCDLQANFAYFSEAGAEDMYNRIIRWIDYMPEAEAVDRRVTDVNGHTAYIVKVMDNNEDPAEFILIDNENVTSCIIIAPAYIRESDPEKISAAIDEAAGQILAGLKLSAPASSRAEINGSIPDLNAPPKEIEAYGFKFTVPGYFTTENLGSYCYDIGFSYSYGLRIRMTDDIFSEKRDSVLVPFGTTDLNGRSFEVYKGAVDYGYNYTYYSPQDGLMLQLSMPEGQEESEYVRDLYWVMCSIRN